MPKFKHGTKKQQERYERVLRAVKREGNTKNPYAVAYSQVYGHKKLSTAHHPKANHHKKH